MADAKDHALWEAARATAAQLSDADLLHQIRANRALAAALRQEAAARDQAKRLQAGDVDTQRAAVQRWLDSMPSS